jgi:hypothetical protein
MTFFRKQCPTLLLVGVLVAGCNTGTPSGEPAAGLSAAGDRYLLAEEPAGARGVEEARKEARDGDDVVVVGRIGGDARPWVEGKAAFWIVDPKLKSCKETEDDGCATPWDYCCTPREDLRKLLATIKVTDDKGHTVPVDARILLGLKELQTVVVRGRARRDDKGNLTVLANGVFVRP